MKQNFTHYFKSIILAIVFLLSGTIPTFGQQQLQLYIYNEDGYSIYNVYNNKVTINDSNPFYLVVFDGLSYNSIYSSYSSSDVVNITTNAYTGNPIPIELNNNDCLTNDLLGQLQKFQIPTNEGSRELCWKYDYYTFSIAIHELSEVQGSKEATCSEDGYVTYKCRHCGETRTEIFKATGHSFGEWQEMEMGNGRFRTCTHDESHKQYNMDATGVNALELTLTDGTTLTYPHTLRPNLTFNNYDVAVKFDQDKTSLVNKADIKKYNQVWSHNKNVSTQNETDKTYKLKCDYESCGYEHTDLYVKNAGQYYVANKENGVIRVTNMTLNDSEGYDCEADFTATNLTYNRTFSNGYWQAVYVPFAIDCSKLPADMEIAVINNFHEYEQEDGSYNVVLEVKRKTSDIIPALTPCVIRMKTAPAEAIEKPLYFSDAEFYAAADKFIDCSSVTRYYKFIGTLAGKTAGTLKDGEDFVLNLGTLYKANGETTLNPQRWYLTATDRNGSSTSATMLRSISLSVIGDSDGDVTGIETVHVVTEKATSVREGIFDLQGRRLNSEPTNGIYIKNGVKYVK